MKVDPSIIFISLLLTGCFGNKSTFNQIEKIDKFGEAVRIEYFKNSHGRAFDYSDTASFVITEPKAVKTVMDEIKNADNPEPWKGAGWDRIKIFYKDTILNISTNGKRIGLSISSGTFYSLDKENFITERIGER